MKAVTGSVTSSRAISLSKAARVLSRFVSTENGASQAVSAYLKRASSSFDELIQFHKNLKSRNHSNLNAETERQGRNLEEEIGHFDDQGKRKKKRKRNSLEVVEDEQEEKKKVKNVEMEDALDYNNDNDGAHDSRRRKKKKKKKTRIQSEGKED